MMEERRKNRRMELDSKLLIKSLNDNPQEVAIEVTDVSKTGIGFICDTPLTIGTVYEAYLTIWMKERLHIFLEIIRMDKLDENRYNYGAIFIGMPEMDSKRIETYDTMNAMGNINEADSAEHLN